MIRDWLISKFRTFIAIALMCFCAASCQYDSLSNNPSPPAELPSTMNYSDWAAFLSAATTPDGYVKWDDIQSNTGAIRRPLMAFIGLVNAVSPANHPELFPTANDRIAYWINASNAMCIYAVVRNNYPANMLAGQPAGDILSQDEYLFGGETMTLTDVVQKKLEAYNDPRIFFALNFCAASCPPLRSNPYDGAVLDAQLVDQGQRYLSDPRAAVRDGDAVKLSDLLIRMHQYDFIAGYKKIFGVAPTGILQALQPYVQSDSPIVGATSAKDMGFDWRLNRPPR